MKTSMKRIALTGLSLLCVLLLFVSVLTQSKDLAVADDAQTTIASTYFYDHLFIKENGVDVDFVLAKKFYKALEEINNSGDFLDGVVDYSLNEHGILNSNEVQGYAVNGDVTVPRAFGAARDAFLTDHPELFYVDFYKLTISVMKKGSEYIAFIDSGREANVYYDNGFTTQAQVEQAITAFNTAVDALVAEANAAQANDVYSERDVYLARYVNNALAQSINYDYTAYDERDNPDAQLSAHIYTSYGGLVVKTAVCSGYSRAYKVIMDKLGVPCITVNGYSNQKDEQGINSGSSIYHMWNNVWLANPATAQSASETAYAASTDGEWYSVDVTWNSSSTNKNRYAILNATFDAENHVTDGVISSSNYELRYPTLSSHNYGSTGSTDGLHSSIEYIPLQDGSLDDYGNPLVSNYSSVSYNGKSAKRLLEEDKLYIVCRFAYYDNTNLAWTKWLALDSYREFATIGVDRPELYFQDDGNETRFYDNTAVYYTQFAVFEIAPDIPNHVHSDSLGIDKDFYFNYTDEIVNKNKAIAVGEAQVNKSFGTYTPAPYISSSTPSHQVEQVISDGMRDNKITDKVMMAESKAYTIEITYDEELHVLNDTLPISVSFVSEHPNAKDYAQFFPINENGDLVELVERPRNSGDQTLVKNTLRFKFAPSLLYEHNREGYDFIFTNVGSAKQVARIVDGQTVFETSDKLPNPAHYLFGRLYMACPARFNYDGRLWVECCAQPTLVANSDLSVDNFEDEDGTTFSVNERSQMMLVAEKADTSTVNTMLDEISGRDDINVNKEEIINSETYDISLQICGKYPKIPDGSYVKIGLGFPEGYGPDDEGVTFKLFHRKHLGGDNYVIEEVPCVVTQFGIVATVTSFSPYMVAVVDAEKATDKNVFASIEGKGGKLSKADGKILALKETDDPETVDIDERTHTYSIIPDEGYQIFSVKLNGTEIKDRIVEGQLTLNYSDEDLLANNELEIQYIANTAAQRYSDKAQNEGLELVEPVRIIVQVGELYPDTVYTNQPKNTVLIICLVTLAVVVVAVAVIVTVVVVKKKKSAKQ